MPTDLEKGTAHTTTLSVIRNESQETLATTHSSGSLSTPYNPSLASMGTSKVEDNKGPVVLEHKDHVLVENRMVGGEKEALVLPRQWGNPWLRRLRCRSCIILFPLLFPRASLHKPIMNTSRAQQHKHCAIPRCTC